MALYWQLIFIFGYQVINNFFIHFFAGQGLEMVHEEDSGCLERGA
jgi:hypothetical protein